MATLIRPKRWGQQKPPAGTQINRGHPLAQGLVACVVPTGGMPFDLVRNVRIDQGADPTNNYVEDGTRGKVMRQNGSGSGTGGWAFPDSAFVPTSSVTIMLAQRQMAASGNQRASFGPISATDGDRCGAHLPWTDNVVYWDFGGSGSAPNRLSVSGLTFGDDVWTFTNGRRGPTIWQNAVLKASNSSAATRNATTSAKFWIGNGQGNGFAGVGNIAFGFFYMWARELTGSEIQQLYAEPYSFFVPQAPRQRYWSVPPSTVSYSVSLTDTVSISDSVTRTATDPRALSDTVAVSDTAARTATDARALADTVAISDTVSRTDADPKSLTDTIPISDTISRTAADSRALADTVPITDALSRTAGDPRTLADSVPISDSIDRLVDAGRLLADTVPVSDIVLRQLADARALADLVAISDTLTVEVFDPSSPGRATGTVTRSNRAIVTVTYARRVTASTDRAARLSGRAQRVGSP